MRGSDFTFDSVQLLYYKCHEINFRRRGAYIDSPVWIKKKKASINPRNKNDKCVQHAATVIEKLSGAQIDFQVLTHL